jgi:hypothetical protein
MEVPLWTPNCKIDKLYSHIANLFILYTWELNFGQTIWDKIEMLLGTPYLKNNLGTWGISLEDDENMFGTRKKNQKITPPTPTRPPKEKKTGPMMMSA